MKTDARAEFNFLIIRCLTFLVLGMTASTFFALRGLAQEPGTPLIQTVKVGEYPDGLAFDGENVWVVNSHDNTVMKRAADGRRQTASYLSGRGFAGFCDLRRLQYLGQHQW